MFEVIEIKNYDVRNRWGIDWHTDYHIKTDEEHTTDTLFERLKELNYSPYGQVSSEKTEDGYIYKAVMY